jgi:hypothetical protein
MTDENKVVPFGKYKGRHVAEMIADRQYCEWLASQGWFAEKYQPIYQIVVMGGPEPQDTPAHNRLQAMFLNDGFCERFIKKFSSSPKQPSYTYSFGEGHLWLTPKNTTREVRAEKLITCELTKIQFRREFECDRSQIDVLLTVYYYFSGTARGVDGGMFEFEDESASKDFSIEIKPSLGDDFPSVLRQARAKRCGIVAFETFTATTVRIEQVREMFKPIRLVSIADMADMPF